MRYKIAAFVALAFTIALVASPIASAHYPVIVASLSCGGTVTYTVTADELNATRNNPDVAVTDTSGSAQPVSAGVFNSANNWSFSGSYAIPTSVSVDTLTAQALSPWGDGYFNPSNDSSATVTRPTDCTSITTSLSSSTITAGGSASDSATLSGATSNAGGTVTYALYADSNCSTISTSPTLTQTVDVSDGSVPNSSAVEFPSAGAYYWQTAYSGDSSNNASTSPCTSEMLTVNAPPLPPTPAPTPAATSLVQSSPSTPAILIIKSPATQTIASGGTATFTIIVTNSGDVVLDNVVVTDAQSPACSKTSATVAGLASMAPGASVSYVCKLANVTAGFTNFATDTGTPPTGPTVSATDSALVLVRQVFTPPSLAVTHTVVAHPSISIQKDPKSQTVESGGTAKFTIIVKNTGDVALTDVTVHDPLSSACDHGFGTLSASETESYSCARSDVTTGFTNTAEATGTPPTGPEVSSSASASIKTATFTPPVIKSPPVAKITRDSTTAIKFVARPRKVRAKAKPVVVSHVVPRTTG